MRSVGSSAITEAERVPSSVSRAISPNDEPASVHPHTSVSGQANTVRVKPRRSDAVVDWIGVWQLAIES